MYWGPDGWGAGGWIVMMLMMLGFWALVALAVVWVVRSTSAQPGKGTKAESNAIAILEERFARGEIDRDEFEQRKATLAGRSSG